MNLALRQHVISGGECIGTTISVVKDINAACLPNKSRLLQALHR